MKYKAVLFDMDGVILNSEPLHVAAFQATLKKYGHNLDDIGYKNHFAGRTDEAGFIQYFKFVNEEVDLPKIMDGKAKAYIELASDQLVPYPGIVSLIRQLSSNVPLALVTGSLRIEAEIALRTFEITDCFTVIIAAGDISQSKPNPEGYLKASNILNIDPKNCVVVEDSPSGIQAANNAGIDCIAVTNTHPFDELSHATKIVDQLDIGIF